MKGLPEDFLAAVKPAQYDCRTNSVFEVNSLDGTEFKTNMVYQMVSKFFMLSRPEIWGTYGSTAYKDGTQLEYYKGLTNAEIIIRDPAGNARYVWLRSPYPGSAYYERIVDTSGGVSSYSANNSTGAVAACIISKS